MWALGKNNWIKYGWTTELLRDRKVGDPLVIKSDYIREPNTKLPIDIAVENILDISRNFPAPYTLMCSGGADSQAMISAWIKSNVPFNVLSVRYISDGVFFNDYDLVHLDKFSKQKNINVAYHDLDIVKFLESDLSKYNSEFNCVSPHMATHMKMTDFVPEGTVLYSGNYIELSGSILTYPRLGLHQFSLLQPRKELRIIPFFFLEYPDLAHSFLDLRRANIDASKAELYQLAGFDIVPPEKEQTGFEEIKNFYDKYKIPAFDRLKYSSKASRRAFDLMFRYPYEGCENRREVQYFNLK